MFQGNGLRYRMAKFGIVAAQGLKGLHALMQLLDDPATPLPDLARMALQMLARQWETRTRRFANWKPRSCVPPRAMRRRTTADEKVPRWQPPSRPRCRMPACSRARATFRLQSGFRRASSAPAANSTQVESELGNGELRGWPSWVPPPTCVTRSLAARAIPGCARCWRGGGGGASGGGAGRQDTTPSGPCLVSGGAGSGPAPARRHGSAGRVRATPTTAPRRRVGMAGR